VGAADRSKPGGTDPRWGGTAQSSSPSSDDVAGDGATLTMSSPSRMTPSNWTTGNPQRDVRIWAPQSPSCCGSSALSNMTKISDLKNHLHY
jgi:hypothetical protein